MDSSNKTAVTRDFLAELWCLECFLGSFFVKLTSQDMNFHLNVKLIKLFWEHQQLLNAGRGQCVPLFPQHISLQPPSDWRWTDRTLNYVIGLCALLICAMQFELILLKQELRVRLVFTRFSLWRRLQNHTRTTSFSRWRPLAIRAISWEDGLLFSTKLRSRASLAPRLQGETRKREEGGWAIWNPTTSYDTDRIFSSYGWYLIVVLLFLLRSFIPILSLYKAAEGKGMC